MVSTAEFSFRVVPLASVASGNGRDSATSSHEAGREVAPFVTVRER